MVSGRHLKDFCEFLQSQSDHFVVEGDRVRLKNMPEPSNAGIELDDEGKPLAGVKAKEAAVDYLRAILEQVSFLLTSKGFEHFKTHNKNFGLLLRT